MIKTLIRIFLLFCIIPLSGHSIAHMHSYPKLSDYSSLNNTGEYKNINHNTGNSSQAFYKASKPSRENGFEISVADVTETENKEITVAKLFKSNYFFTVLIIAFSLISILNTIKQNISLFNRLLSIIDKPYIEIRAIRI